MVNDQKERNDQQKVDYETPLLQVLGDLRFLTLGGSSGVGDSGTSTTREWPRG